MWGTSVAEGREEYYTGAGEAPGTWIGSGIGTLGLSGEVRPDDLRSVLDGISPADGTAIARKRNDLRGRVAGFDLTFSAPKSASLLYGLGSPDTSAAVRASHDHAVAEAVEYLERHAVFARRGHDGANRIGTFGLIAAAFVHRTSRTGDPQLHTHVLTANAVLGADGRWSAPDARLLYFHGRTAGFVYQASLRAGLVEALGVHFGPVRRGSAEVSGFDPSLLRGFSTRRAEIEEYLFLRGESSRRTAELAALATREPKAQRKDISLDSAGLRERWRARAIELGVDPDARLYEQGTPRRVTLRPETAGQIAGELLSPEGLTVQESTFERRDVVRAIAERLSEGAALEDIERLADQVLRDAGVVELGMPAAAVSISRRLPSCSGSRRRSSSGPRSTLGGSAPGSTLTGSARCCRTTTPFRASSGRWSSDWPPPEPVLNWSSAKPVRARRPRSRWPARPSRSPASRSPAPRSRPAPRKSSRGAPA